MDIIWQMNVLLIDETDGWNIQYHLMTFKNLNKRRYRLILNN